MKRRTYNILYGVIMTAIVVVFLAFSPADGMQMFLGAFAIVLTSIFTYSNRAILRRRHQSERS